MDESEASASQRTPARALEQAAPGTLDAVEARLRAQGFAILRLDGREVADRASLMVAVTRDLPALDAVRPTNWSGLGDGLASMVFEREVPRVALLWSRADRLRDGDPAAFATARALLAEVSRLARSQAITFVTVVECDERGAR